MHGFLPSAQSVRKIGGFDFQDRRFQPLTHSSIADFTATRRDCPELKAGGAGDSCGYLLDSGGHEFESIDSERWLAEGAQRLSAVPARSMTNFSPRH